MANVSEAILPWIEIVFVVVSMAFFYYVAASLVWIIVLSVRHNASLRRRALPLPPRIGQSAKDWAWGFFFLVFGALLAEHIVDGQARPHWQNVMFAIPVAVIFFGASWMILLGRGESDLPETLAYFDSYGRLRPGALARKKGALAVAAKVLHRNIDPLKGKFTVITSADDDREMFPRGRGQLAPRYVALVSNREPVGLFFHRGEVIPNNRVLYIKEVRYELVYGKDLRGNRCVFADIVSGGRIPRRGQIRDRLIGARLTEQNVQRVIDAFVAKESTAAIAHLAHIEAVDRAAMLQV